MIVAFCVKESTTLQTFHNILSFCKFDLDCRG